MKDIGQSSIGWTRCVRIDLFMRCLETSCVPSRLRIEVRFPILEFERMGDPRILSKVSHLFVNIFHTILYESFSWNHVMEAQCHIEENRGIEYRNNIGNNIRVLK